MRSLFARLGAWYSREPFRLDSDLTRYRYTK